MVATLTSQTFVAKWRKTTLKESAAANEHFIYLSYLSRLLDHPTPADAGLKKRTLTNLYDARSTWLDNAHKKLDAAVFAAYGWPADPSTALRQAQDDSSGHGPSDEEILERLLTLNLARAESR
jgi:hypothetical protein